MPVDMAFFARAGAKPFYAQIEISLVIWGFLGLRTVPRKPIYGTVTREKAIK